MIPDHLLFHRRRRAPARPAVGRRGALRSFADLRAGDIVVHEDHGIARFAGFDTRTVAGVTRDYLYLEYQGDDRVYAPTDQFAKISRYVGAGGAQPTLSRLGGARWDTLKARARHAAQELAGELLSLYVERRRREGHAFAADGDWQREFEQRFPYTETPDQREAIESVKADMEEPRPMDRLICGDVGYGKTEVALRAAFKAAADGKQVLVLAPTTILAQQHFGTFRERLADYPFTVDVLSRFRSAAEQRDTLARFADGRLDILIGTHRLLSRDVRPKDLGLLIIDEEQRFGVKQKELLRQLRLRVDVIAMSATPIPRSLQMSLAGLRDISVIETAPEGRRPVRTYVGEYDEALVRQALERERARGGQAFYLHNRVETIDEVAERLRGLCPEIRFAVAHGQLEEQELESRMMSFLRGDVDVLVCTSIIESGIDIPAANTLIVERSDHFGLAQLYQIRGRVGRSRERAYAYMLYDAAASLTPEGAQRLAALSDFTELGSGFQIAMRDLELRGAGNLLGDEQSGHVAALGFELYMQMLDEALAAAEASGEPRDGDWEPVRLDVDVDAYVPADYVGYEQAKIDLHRRIAGARDVADIEALREELGDRFGPPPEPVEHLLALQRARIKLGAAGARAVSVRAGRLVIAPIELDSAGVRELRGRLPHAIYESGRSQVSSASGGGTRASASPDLRRRRRGPRGQRRAVSDDRLRGRPARFASIRGKLPRRLRIGMAFCAAIATAVVLGACGSERRARATPLPWSAARRSPRPRSRHWLAVANDTNQASTGVAAPPLPLPPDYKACIAAAKRRPAPETAGALKAACAQNYQALLDQILPFLIQTIWIQGEAVDRGVKVSHAQINKSFDAAARNSLEAAAEDGSRAQRASWRSRARRSPTSSGTSTSSCSTTQIEARSTEAGRQGHPGGRSRRTTQEPSPSSLTAGDAQPAPRSRPRTRRPPRASSRCSRADRATRRSRRSTRSTRRRRPPAARWSAVRPSELTAQLSAAVFAAKAGVLVGPIKTAFGYYVFTVDSTTPGRRPDARGRRPRTIKATMLAEQAGRTAETRARRPPSPRNGRRAPTAAPATSSPTVRTRPRHGATGAQPARPAAERR